MPARGHLAKQFYLPCCPANNSLSARAEIYLAVDWRWTFILNAWGMCSSWLLRKRVSTVSYLATDISLYSGFACHNRKEDIWTVISET
jgi:hypothetical protein